MNRLYKALYEIESILCVGPPWTVRENKIYSIACAALNLVDGEAGTLAAEALSEAAIAAAEPEPEAAEGRK